MKTSNDFMGKITVITSNNSTKLDSLYRVWNDIKQNKELCKLLKVPVNVEPFDYFIWGFRENNSMPSEINGSLMHRFFLFKNGTFKNLVIITNNIFSLHAINVVIGSKYLPVESFEAYNFINGKPKKEPVTDNGIYPGFINAEYKDVVLSLSKTFERPIIEQVSTPNTIDFNLIQKPSESSQNWRNSFSDRPNKWIPLWIEKGESPTYSGLAIYVECIYYPPNLCGMSAYVTLIRKGDALIAGKWLLGEFMFHEMDVPNFSFKVTDEQGEKKYPIVLSKNNPYK